MLGEKSLEGIRQTRAGSREVFMNARNVAKWVAWFSGSVAVLLLLSGCASIQGGIDVELGLPEEIKTP